MEAIWGPCTTLFSQKEYCGTGIGGGGGNDPSKVTLIHLHFLVTCCSLPLPWPTNLQMSASPTFPTKQNAASYQEVIGLEK